MKHQKHLLIAFVIALSLLLVAPAGSQAQSPLTKPIEFVCHAAPGGGLTSRPGSSKASSKRKSSAPNRSPSSTGPVAAVPLPSPTSRGEG